VFWGEKRRTTNSTATTFSYTRVLEGVAGGGASGGPGYPLLHPGVREGGGGRVGGSAFLPPKHAPPPSRKNCWSPLA
jgi:hypothetical protein